MASHFQSARHVAARNTILLWLSGVIVLAGIGILVTYHALRHQQVQTGSSPAAVSRRLDYPATTPPRPAARVTDSTAIVAREHRDAVTEAKAVPTATSDKAETPKP